MPRRLHPTVIIALLLPLSGCAGFGDYAWHTADPFHTPHKVKVVSENVALARGKKVPPANLTPEAGQPWPTSYPVDPTIVDVERSGTAP